MVVTAVRHTGMGFTPAAVLVKPRPVTLSSQAARDVSNQTLFATHSHSAQSALTDEGVNQVNTRSASDLVLHEPRSDNNAGGHMLLTYAQALSVAHDNLHRTMVGC
jgi:kynureninase